MLVAVATGNALGGSTYPSLPLAANIDGMSLRLVRMHVTSRDKHSSTTPPLVTMSARSFSISA